MKPIVSASRLEASGVGVPRHPVHACYISSRKICRGSIDVDFLRRACARRVGADKSLSNCSLKNSAAVAPSLDGARQRPAALKPGPDVLYFARPAGRAGQSGRSGSRSRRGLFIDIYSWRWQGTTRIDAKGCAFVREDNIGARVFFRVVGGFSLSRGNDMWDAVARVDVKL